MGLPPQPLKAVFPIVLARRVPELEYTFLGTGFFVDANGSFLTARHILPEDLDISKGDTYNAVMLDLSINKADPCAISGLRFSDQFDIALGRVEGFQDIQPLNLATKNAPMNFDILTAEFSGTYPQRVENGKVALTFNPYFRKGHVVCYYKSTFPEVIPTECLDVSFAALKGSCGAPVIAEDGSVVGMIVGNVERDLMPAQVERITNGKKFIEERKYFLPIGKAISWRHLADFIKSARM